MVFSVSVVTCTAYRMHLIRTCAGLPFYVLPEVQMCFIQLSCVLLFLFYFYRGISSTLELFEFVLRPRTALYCGDELTPLEPQSRFGDKLLEIRVECPQNGTAVLKGLM